MSPKGEPAEREEVSDEQSSACRDETRDRPKEVGGPKGPEPTRYGDWERNGRCSDF